jgi:hypothetical protein
MLQAVVSAQVISFTAVPSGYEAGSINLPEGFAGALAADPLNDQIIYASVGAFWDNKIVRIDLQSGSVERIADGPFGSIGGIAALSPTQLVLTENDHSPGSPLPGETILLATDFNPQDGDFNDAGEIIELIAPILTDSLFGFTGAQARVAPSGNPSGIPSGSLVFQNADGAGLADLFVVEEPTTPGTAKYRPSGGHYFGGFDYNGGFDFDSRGRIFMGAVDGATFAGMVYALVNSNSDEDIDGGEYNDVVTTASLPAGIADLIIDAEDTAFCLTNPFLAGGRVVKFLVPENPLIAQAAIQEFAVTDAGYLTAVMINSKRRSFEPWSGRNGATLLFGGYTSTWAQATNLLTLEPAAPAAARLWDAYR